MNEPEVIGDADLDELRRLGDELRAAFTQERRAITHLDHAALTWLAEHKQRVAVQLGELRARVTGPLPRELRELFAAIRAEAHATAMLANTAARAVRALLGYEAPGNYDRRARQPTARVGRALMTY